MMDENNVMILELRKAAYDYAEIVRELRQDASTSRDLYLADAIEALSVECKEWKELGDALKKTLNVAFSDFAKIEKNRSWIPAMKPPKEGEPVFVHIPCRYRKQESIPMIAFWEQGQWKEYESHRSVYNITHWMPLPLPPTSKEETE